MSPLKAALMAATLIGGTAAAWAQSTATFDPAQLPETKGRVAQYTLTPRGDVDGLILEDGTEVNTSPRMSTELVFAVKPGDAVTIHGLKAAKIPLVAASSVTNDATRITVTEPNRREPGGAPMEAGGTVKAALHGPRGDVNGVLLADGTVVRMPPPEAERMSAQLAVGQAIFVRGDGDAGPLGRVIGAREIGPNANSLTRVGGPPHWERWMHDKIHGKPRPGDDHGPGFGRGPGGDEPRPPPAP